MISVRQARRAEELLGIKIIELLREEPTIDQLGMLVYCVDGDEQVDYHDWIEQQSWADIMGRGMRLFSETVKGLAAAAGTDDDFLASSSPGSEPKERPFV